MLDKVENILNRALSCGLKNNLNAAFYLGNTLTISTGPFLFHPDVLISK